MPYTKIADKASGPRTSHHSVSRSNFVERPNKPKKDHALEAFASKKNRQVRRMVYGLFIGLVLFIGVVALFASLSGSNPSQSGL